MSDFAGSVTHDLESAGIGGEDVGGGIREDSGHGLGDGFGMFDGETEDGAAGAAEPATEGTGLFSGADHAIEFGDESLAVGLMDTIGEGAAEGIDVAHGEGGGDEGGAAEVVEGVLFGEGIRDQSAGGFGGDFEGGDEGDEAEGSGNGQADAPGLFAHDGGDGEAAVGGGGGVIGMTFEVGDPGEEIIAGDTGAGEMIEGGHDAESQGDGRSQTAGDGDFAIEVDFEAEGGLVGMAEEAAGGVGDEALSGGAGGGVDGGSEVGCPGWERTWGEADAVMEVEGDAEGIEAGAKVGSAGGDGDEDAFHGMGGGGGHGNGEWGMGRGNGEGGISLRP